MKFNMLYHIEVYHNAYSRFDAYEDGHLLERVAEFHHWADDKYAAADWAFRVFNMDLDMYDRAANEQAFLAAAVYRALGRRSLSVGDVLHVTEVPDYALPDLDGGLWLACVSVGWQTVQRPSRLSPARVSMADEIHEAGRLSALRRTELGRLLREPVKRRHSGQFPATPERVSLFLRHNYRAADGSALSEVALLSLLVRYADVIKRAIEHDSRAWVPGEEIASMAGLVNADANERD